MFLKTHLVQNYPGRTHKHTFHKRTMGSRDDPSTFFFTRIWRRCRWRFGLLMPHMAYFPRRPVGLHIITGHDETGLPGDCCSHPSLPLIHHCRLTTIVTGIFTYPLSPSHVAPPLGFHPCHCCVQRRVVQRASPFGRRQPGASLRNFRILQARRGMTARVVQ